MLTVWFTNSEKGLPLNRTNNRTLRGAFGDPVSAWTDKIFILYRAEAEFRGRMVPALRIRIPPSKQATAKPKPPLKDDLDDEIGF